MKRVKTWKDGVGEQKTNHGFSIETNVAAEATKRRKLRKRQKLSGSKNGSPASCVSHGGLSLLPMFWM